MFENATLDVKDSIDFGSNPIKDFVNNKKGRSIEILAPDPISKSPINRNGDATGKQY